MRPPPLRQVATTRTIRATDFGATPDDAGDDQAGFQRALDAVAAQPDPRVRIQLE